MSRKKMKVLLVQPLLMLNEKSFLYKKFSTYELSLSLGYLGAVLRQDGIETYVVDQNAKRVRNDTLIDFIKSEAPDVIGFSCFTLSMGNIPYLVNHIRGLKNNIRIILGNIHPTACADRLLRQGLADIIVRGEGEYSLLEVVKAIEECKSLESIHGISFVDGETVYHNPDRVPIGNLDDLPYPDWDLFDLNDYHGAPMMGIYGLSIPIIASRGCLYSCSFCAKEKIFKGIRYRKIKQVVNEIEYMHKKYKANFFAFHDATFPASIEQGLEFCDEIACRKTIDKVKFTMATRVNLLNEELLIKFKKAGLHLIMYGFESGNQRVLDSVGKRITLEQMRKAIRETKKAGILTHGAFIIGLPGETKQTCEETIAFAKESGCDIARFGIFVPYPGSKLFEELKDRIGNIDDYIKFDPQSEHNKGLIYAPEGMSERELISLHGEAYFKFYLRPMFILYHIMKRTFKFKDLCYGALTIILKRLKIFLIENNRKQKYSLAEYSRIK